MRARHFATSRDGRCDSQPLLRPAPTCTETCEWLELSESLRTNIVEDNDFEMAMHFLD